MARNRPILWLAFGATALLTIPLWVRSDFYLHLLDEAIIYIICVVGLNIIIGETGQISLGHAAFLGVGAYTAAILGTRLHWNFWAGTLAAALLTTVLAVVLGYPTLKLKGHYLAIATIGLGEIMRLIFNNWRSLTGGFDGIAEIPPPVFFGYVIQGNVPFYYLLLVFAAAMTFLAVRIKQSTFGLAMIAVRDNEIAAETTGIRISGHKILAFSLSGLYAGVAGSLYAHFFAYIAPDTFDTSLSIVFLAMLIVGGIGRVSGAVVGAFLLTLLPELLRFLEEYYMVLYSVVVILTVVFMPMGIVGRIARWQQSRQAAMTPVAEEVPRG
jgi:branched-chain amino acid transport system permease protein